jgi:hypothetical protein
LATEAVGAAGDGENAPVAATAARAAEPAESEARGTPKQQLLAACKRAAKVLHEYEIEADTLPMLRAAIARAEGQRKPPEPRQLGRPRRSGQGRRENTKEALVIEMLGRPEGATIAQIMAATGWQAHTCRGAFAGALKKKRGLMVTSEKGDSGERVYRLAE